MTEDPNIDRETDRVGEETSAEHPLSRVGGIAKSRLARVIVGIVALVVVAAGVVYLVQRADRLPSDVALQIGDQTISKTEYSRRVAVLEALYGLQKPESGSALDKFKRDAAKSIAVSTILDRAALDHDIVIADKLSEDTLTKFIDQQLADGEDGFVQFLASNGLSRSDVLDEVKRQLATAQLFSVITKNVQPVTDAEVESEYLRRKAEMVSAEKRHLLNIVVRTEVDADSVLTQLKSGASFKTVAAQYSLDASTNKAGGDLGTLTADQLDATFAKAAFGVSNGAFFGPVKSRFGWNVGKVVGVVPGSPLTLNQVRTEFRASLDNERQLSAWRTWLSSQIKEADVRYADEYRPENPDAAPSTSPTAP